MENMNYWNAVKRPPTTALKTIKGGTLSGMSNIDPQWRYQVMTETFGPIGSGWTVRIIQQWSEEVGDQVICFVKVAMKYKVEGEWTEEFEGVGGNILKHPKGKVSDEGYKMAYSDAISVAMKMLGVAADIYMGKFDGAKYTDTSDSKPVKDVTEEQIKDIKFSLAALDSDEAKFLEYIGCKSFEEMTSAQFKRGLVALQKKRDEKGRV